MRSKADDLSLAGLLSCQHAKLPPANGLPGVSKCMLDMLILRMRHGTAVTETKAREARRIKICPYCHAPHRSSAAFCSAEHCRAYKAERKGDQ